MVRRRSMRAAMPCLESPAPRSEIATAENGPLALDAAQRVVPDVVVTDVSMPVMDGLALCRRLRADAATRDVVVVVVTGDPSDDGQAALDAGCDAVLGKPCSQIG